MGAHKGLTSADREVRESHIQRLLARVQLQSQKFRDVLGHEIFGGTCVCEGVGPMAPDSRFEKEALISPVGVVVVRGGNHTIYRATCQQIRTLYECG